MHKIIYIEDNREIPGYEETPYNDGCFLHDPKRVKQAEVNALIDLMENDDMLYNNNLEKVQARCDYGGKSIDSDLSVSDKS
jgi:hypothetical protein